MFPLATMESKEVKEHIKLVHSGSSMTPLEQKIFIFTLLNLNQQEDKFTPIEWDVVTFCKYWRIEKRSEGNIYRELAWKPAKRSALAAPTSPRPVAAGEAPDAVPAKPRKPWAPKEKGVLLRLLDHKFTRLSMDGQYEVIEHINLCTKAKYHPGKGKVTITFHEDMVPYLLRLSSQYLAYNPKFIIGFQSSYSLPLYKLLRQYCPTIPRRTFTLEGLKKLFQVEDKYERFDQFRVRVLDMAVREINEYSDIYVEWCKISTDKKVVGIVFAIEPSNTNLTPAEKHAWLATKKKKHLLEWVDAMVVKYLRGTYRMNEKQACEIAMLYHARDTDPKVGKLWVDVAKRAYEYSKKAKNPGAYAFKVLRDEALKTLYMSPGTEVQGTLPLD